MASSGSIILSTYGSWVPNIKKDPHICTANMWSFWTFYIGPILLWQWFNNVKYYKHFFLFVKLLTICLKFEITCEEIDLVCTGFVDQVAKYERYVLFVQVLWVCIMIIATLILLFSDFTISMIQAAYLHVQSQSMPYSILLTVSRLVGLCGVTGHSQWNTIATASSLQFVIGNPPMLPSISTFLKMHSSHR